MCSCEDLNSHPPEDIAIENDIYICKLCGVELRLPAYETSYSGMASSSVPNVKTISPPNARFEWILDRFVGSPPISKKRERSCEYVC